MVSFEKEIKVHSEDIFIVKDLQSPLEDRPAIESLNLVTHNIEPSVTTDKPKTKDLVIKEFPSFFSQFGRLQGLILSYQAERTSGPLSLNSPRQVAITLLCQVKKELERMENLGVISLV